MSDRLMQALRSGHAAAVGAELSNDLQPAALSLRPACARPSTIGEEYSALGGIVSGSGPTVAFLVADADRALDLAVALSASGTCQSVQRVVRSGPRGPVRGPAAAALSRGAIFSVMTRVGVEWGLQGALNYAPSVDAIVVVDVLSFSTSVAVAVGRGAQVWPHPGGPGARELADEVDGLLAGRRTLDRRPLAVAHLTARPARRARGWCCPRPTAAPIAYSLAAQPCQVFAGALRNASAVGRYLAEAPAIGPVVIVPAGERWPDDSIRVAYEDLVGAGAIISRMLAVDPLVGAQRPRPRRPSRRTSGCGRSRTRPRGRSWSSGTSATTCCWRRRSTSRPSCRC